jgi:outer membrane protein OmpA-like peptidoglycan-associated protein
VALSNLFIAPPDPNAPVVKKAEMPIETVLDLLRDGEDRIRLSLPVRGDAANPDVDISDAVAQAVAGALKSTVLTTLKLAFPVAALIELALDDSNKAHLALAPVTFAPGSDALGAEQEKTLTGVADLLKGRPGLKLTLCGKADDSDWPVVAARRRTAEKPLLSKLEQMVGYERAPESLGPPDRNLLSALAQRRTDAVRNHLVDKGAIETGRLFGCRPMVEASGKGPRTDLLL